MKTPSSPPEIFNVDDIVFVHGSKFYWRVIETKLVYFTDPRDIYYSNGEYYPWIYEGAKVGGIKDQDLKLVRVADFKGKKLKGVKETEISQRYCTLLSEYFAAEYNKMKQLCEMLSLPIPV